MVRLKIRKEDEEENGISFTVELKRNGGPLGITITGSDDPFDPIVISGLAPGGIAERTRAIHVGDKILTINGISLKTKPLQEAIQLLMNAGEVLQLRIEKDESPASKASSQTTEKPSLTTGALFAQQIAEEDGTDDENAQNNEKPISPIGRASPYSRNNPSDYSKDSVEQRDSALESWESGNSELSGNSFNSKLNKNMSRRHPNFSSKTLGSLREKERVENGKTKTLDRVPYGSMNRVNARGRTMSYDRPVQQKNFQSMDNIRRHPRSSSQEFRSRNNSRGNSRYNSRENSRERASSRERERRPPEIRNIKIEDSPASSKRNRDRKPLRQYDENQSSDESNWDMALNKNRRGEDSDRPASESSEFLDDVIRDLRSVATAGYRENIRAIVFKDIDKGSFGFSVSDGAVDKGVFIHSVKPDGPAARAGVYPYDRILQINNTRCNDMQSQAVLTLIGKCGNRLRLHLSRNPAASSHPRLASPN